MIAALLIYCSHLGSMKQPPPWYQSLAHTSSVINPLHPVFTPLIHSSRAVLVYSKGCICRAGNRPSLQIEHFQCGGEQRVFWAMQIAIFSGIVQLVWIVGRTLSSGKDGVAVAC